MFQNFPYTHLNLNFSSIPLDLLVGCSGLSSIPSKHMVKTRCFSCPISTWSLEAVNLTSSSCLCNWLISPLFLSSNFLIELFSFFNSCKRDQVLLKCSLLPISRWFSNWFLLFYVKDPMKKLQLYDVNKWNNLDYFQVVSKRFSMQTVSSSKLVLLRITRIA